MDKKEQVQRLHQQLRERADQLIQQDYIGGKISGAIELLTAQIQEEEATPKERAEKEVAEAKKN